MQLTICAGRHTDRVSTANEQHLTSALWITPTRDGSQSHGKNVAKSMKSKTLASTKELTGEAKHKLTTDSSRRPRKDKFGMISEICNQQHNA